MSNYDIHLKFGKQGMSEYDATRVWKMANDSQDQFSCAIDDDNSLLKNPSLTNNFEKRSK